MILNVLPSVIGTAALAPALLLLWLVVSMDHRREPTRIVAEAFLLGIGSIFLLHIGYWLFFGIATLGNTPEVESYLHATFEVAAPEEGVKLLVLVLFIAPRIEYDHPMEGVVYGAAVGLGFAAYENLGYLASNVTNWHMVALIRGLFTVPFHGTLGMITGLYVARARFGSVGHGSKPRDATAFHARCYLIAWGITTVLHGLFDFPLMLLSLKATKDVSTMLKLEAVSATVALVTAIVAARIIYRVARRKAAAPSPLVRARVETHPWHLTGLAGLVIFLLCLPLLGWARQAWMQ